MAAEGGANTCPHKAAGKGGSASPGAMLEGRYASGTTVDRFAQVKEPSVEPAAAAEGVARAGESAAAHGGGRDSSAGTFICSGRDCIGLGALT